MFNLFQIIQNLTLVSFISNMFVELAENEMDERDYQQLHTSSKKCPLRKFVQTNPK